MNHIAAGSVCQQPHPVSEPLRGSIAVKTPSPSAPKPTFTHELAGDDKSMPLGVGDMSAEDQVLDPLAGTGESRRFNAGSIIIVVVVAIACGGLWFMRSLSHVSTASAAKTDAEQDIEDFLGQRDSKGNPKGGDGKAGVLQVLSSSYTGLQVPLESVKSNPFILPGEDGTKSTGPVFTGDSPEQAMARAREQRQKDFATAFERLTLKSIIMSSQPLANISGMIVRQGDVLSPENSDVTFRVERISNDSVMLIASDIALGMNVEMSLSMRRDM